MNSRTGLRVARLGVLFFFAWGLFHVGVAHDIYLLRVVQLGIAQGRIFQLSACMLSIAAFAICAAAAGNWRNSRAAFWLNLCVVGWADSVWVIVVVLPGYVPLALGLIPRAIVWRRRCSSPWPASRLPLMHKRATAAPTPSIRFELGCAPRLLVPSSVFDSRCIFGRGVQGRKCLRPISGLGDRRLNNLENV
jgi:hypothetical protein